MGTIDLAEALLATIGVTPILKDEMPTIGVRRLGEAGKLSERIDAKIEAMIRGNAKLPALPRPHSYEWLLDRLTSDYPADETQKIINSFPVEQHEISLPFSVLAQDTFNHIRTLLPTSSVQNFAGPRNILPTDDKLWTFYSQLALLDDPLRVLDLIGVAAILPSQVEAVRLIYPTVSTYIDTAVVRATIKATAEKLAEPGKGSPLLNGFQVPPFVEIGLSVWNGRKAIEYGPKPTKPAPAPRLGVPKTLKAADISTVGQKASAS